MTYGTLNADLIGNSNGQTGNAIGPGFKNRIINGAMVIDQRNAGAAVTTNGAYPVDRFVTSFSSSAGTFSAQQSTSVIPNGFSSSVGVTITAADSSIAAAENLLVQQWIEGNNIADLGFGTASAKTVTLSFWVRSSVTGTYCVMIGNSNAGTGAPNRSYVAEYSISAANTWEQKTVTIAGDTSGTWQTGSLRGMVVRFCLTGGTDYQQAAGSWGTANAACTSSQTQLLSTLNATFYITGVQLEVGSSATSFDYRPYGTELALCQRYYYRTTPTSAGRIAMAMSGVTNSTGRSVIPFPVTMRVAPSALEQSGTAGDYSIFFLTTPTACTSVPTFSTGTPQSSEIGWTASSGHTAGNAGTFYSTATAGFLAWSAEL